MAAQDNYYMRLDWARCTGYAIKSPTVFPLYDRPRQWTPNEAETFGSLKIQKKSANLRKFLYLKYVHIVKEQSLYLVLNASSALI